MSKRSPFWQPFAAHTPLGYSIAGQFNTEPGPGYGAIRFTHVDGPLPRAIVTPGLPQPRRPSLVPCGVDLSIPGGVLDIRALERLDGTPIGFYPLFNGDGALVEVVPRTLDAPVVADTSWRSLATLVTAARHAGIEEAVRRQRAIFVFSLVGAANTRLVAYPSEPRLVLHSVLRGNGRSLATYAQVRGYAGQFGLDLPATVAEFDVRRDPEELAGWGGGLVDALDRAHGGALPGRYSHGGLTFWISGRAGATLLEWSPRVAGGGAPDPTDVWEAMARLADQGVAPTRERTAALVAQQLAGTDGGALLSTIGAAWEQWGRLNPEIFRAEPALRAV